MTLRVFSRKRRISRAPSSRAPASLYPAQVNREPPGFASFAGTAALPAVNAGREEFSRLRWSYQQIVRSNLKCGPQLSYPAAQCFYDVGYQGFGFHFNVDAVLSARSASISYGPPSSRRTTINTRSNRRASISTPSTNNIASQRNSSPWNSRSLSIITTRPLRPCWPRPMRSAAPGRLLYRLAEKRFDEGQALAGRTHRRPYANDQRRDPLFAGAARRTKSGRGPERVTAAYKL